MKTISDEYRAANAHEHDKADGYGVRGFKHLDKVLSCAQRFGAASVLDYGCGQGTLADRAKRVSAVPFACYDPAVKRFSAEPKPADLVVCTDVLEHIEPLYLGEVLEHLQLLAVKGLYLQIACRPAKRILDDGRNAHLIIQQPRFWFDTVSQYFEILEYRAEPNHAVLIIARPGGV